MVAAHLGRQVRCPLLDVLVVLHLDPRVGRVSALAVLRDVVAGVFGLFVHTQEPGLSAILDNKYVTVCTRLKCEH